jgi:hypothetical protein
VTDTTAPSRSSARCRARSGMTTQRWRGRASWATGCASARGRSASCNLITCLPTGSAKVTTKATLRAHRLGPSQPAGPGAAGGQFGAAARGLSAPAWRSMRGHLATASPNADDNRTNRAKRESQIKEIRRLTPGLLRNRLLHRHCSGRRSQRPRFFTGDYEATLSAPAVN